MKAWTDFVKPARFAAIKTAIDLKVFESLNEHGGKSVNVSQLAGQTGAEASLLGMFRVGSGLPSVSDCTEL